MNQTRIPFVLALAAAACGCSSTSDDGTPLPGSSGSGGSAQMPTAGMSAGGSSASAGMNAGGASAGASGGAATAGSSVGGSAPIAGAQSTGGTQASGGSQSGGSQSAGGPNGKGGNASGGANAGSPAGGSPSAGSAGLPSAGASTGGSGGGSSGAVMPSAGCSKQSAQVTLPNSRVQLPEGYNGKDPVPVLIAFHGAGNDNTSLEGTFNRNSLSKKYLMVYPNSTSATTSNKTGWNMQADKSRYLELDAALSNDACIDENRVFATGHSSGAQFIVQLLCSGDADFDAIAPVASSVYCQKWKNGAVPSLIIHGVQDEERIKYNLNDGDGKKDLMPYLSSNTCQTTSTPFDPDLSSCNNVNGVDGKPFDDGCVEFSGCAVTTRWCNHNDPQYGTTNHGIPCFGVRAIFDFFNAL